MRKRLLVVDDEEAIREIVTDCLAGEYEVQGAADGMSARIHLAESVPDILVSDVKMPGGGGLELVRLALARYPDLAVVVLTGHPDLGDFIEFFRLGVADYVTKPFSPAELRRTVLRALETRRLRAENARLRSALSLPEPGGDALVGESPVLREVRERLGRVARTDATVLLTGASGTGKDIAARLIHARSPRSHGPFVPLHCGALQEGLLESELFGHARGAFTGAARIRPGRFEEADGGTLFLDEMGTMKEPTQVRFLRALATREVTRVGDDRGRAVDVRVVAATNANLDEMVKRGEFRQDLFHRLSVFPVRMPSLTERLEDLPLLASHLLGRCCGRLGRAPRLLSQDALRALGRYAWPGNVRELENVIERAVILAGPAEVIEEDMILLETPMSRDAVDGRMSETGIDLRRYLAEVEEDLIQQSLERTSYCKQQAAELLGLQRTTLVQKLRRRASRSPRHEGARMSSAAIATGPGLSPFFALWMDRSGRRADWEEPAPTLLPPPPPGSGDLHVAMGAAEWQLRLRAEDLKILTLALAFAEDEEIKQSLSEAPTAAECAAVLDLLGEALPEAGPFTVSSVPRSGSRSLRVDFSIAGFPRASLFLLGADEPGDTGPGPAHGGAEPSPDFAFSPAVQGLVEGRGLPPGRPTALVIDTQAERRDLTTRALLQAGWRILDPLAPRSVLNWALTERVVDVVVLDGSWPHAAQLRQNLGSDPRSAALPVLAPLSGDPTSFVEQAQIAATAKRRSD